MRKSATQLARELYVSLAATPTKEHKSLIREFLERLGLERKSALKPRIIAAFTRLALAVESKTAGTVTTAGELSAPARTKIGKQFPDAAFDFIDRPELVGGAVLQVGDTVTDMSVRTTLASLKKALAG